VDPASIDPQFRSARRLPDLPVRRLWGRMLVRAAMHLIPSRVPDGVRVHRVRTQQCRMRVHRPGREGANPSRGALLWVHGGGLVVGNAALEDAFCGQVARELGITVVAPDYRLAPRHRFPAAHEDVYAAWQWLQFRAGPLGVDPARVAVGGGSAGGNLAAGLVWRLVDEAGVRPAAQWLFAPMLDDRTATRTDLDAVRHWTWDNQSNRFGWTAYLGGAPGASGVHPYASPARRTDMAGSPPTWIGVGDIDLFYREDADYAHRLRAAGTPVRLDVVPGAPHGFEGWGAGTRAGRAFQHRARAWLAAALGRDLTADRY